MKKLTDITKICKNEIRRFVNAKNNSTFAPLKIR